VSFLISWLVGDTVRNIDAFMKTPILKFDFEDFLNKYVRPIFYVSPIGTLGTEQLGSPEEQAQKREQQVQAMREQEAQQAQEGASATPSAPSPEVREQFPEGIPTYYPAMGGSEIHQSIQENYALESEVRKAKDIPALVPTEMVKEDKRKAMFGSLLNQVKDNAQPAPGRMI